MNLKKFISGVSALAIAASAFAGLAVTASAYTVSLSADTTVAGYKDGVFYNFQTNDPAVLPTTGDLRYRSDNNAFGLHNYGSGTRSGDASISVSTGDLLLIETYNTNGNAVTATINCGTANAAASTSSGYTAFDITADADAIKFTVNRYTGIMGALVLKKDTSSATADYTVKYVDGNGAEIQPSTAGNGVVGAVVPVDTSALNINDQKYIYVSDDAASNTIAANGSTVVTVTYRAAAQYSYTVSANVGNVAIASGTAFEGDSVKVAYPKYVNVNGTLYERGVTNKEYNHTFTLDEDNKNVELTYTATTISDVVFLSEGEDIAGLTASTANNTKIRSSKSGSAYAASDTVITSLPAGVYKVYGVLFSASSGGANLSFSLGDNDFSFVSTDNTNWKDVSSDEFTITETSDLVFKAGGGNAAALDFIYVVKTGDYVPPTYNGTVAVEGTFAGDNYDGEATALTATFTLAANESVNSVTVTPAIEGYNAMTKDIQYTGAGDLVIGIVIDQIVDNTAFTAVAQ